MTMSRKEILDLRARFQEQCEKIEKHQGSSLPHPTGLKLVDAELGKHQDAKPTLLLRNLGRLLKHYGEELKKKPNAVIRFNVAASMVERGEDVQQAIRKARVAVDESVDTMEREGYCDAKVHANLRINRHDRILQEMLEI